VEDGERQRFASLPCGRGPRYITTGGATVGEESLLNITGECPLRSDLSGKLRSPDRSDVTDQVQVVPNAMSNLAAHPFGRREPVLGGLCTSTLPRPQASPRRGCRGCGS
jgi:hypothetical protein